MVTPTNVRAGRISRFIAAFQSAYGTAVSNFATATALWTEEGVAQAAPRKVEARGMGGPSSGPAAYGTDARSSLPERPAGTIRVLATPSAIELLFRSNMGAPAGGTFALNTQVAATNWVTLAWVENYAGGAQRILRAQDVFFHRLDLEVPSRGPVVIAAHWAGRRTYNQAMNAGGITLLASPMTPDETIFGVSEDHTNLYRDPTGTNQELKIAGLTMSFDQRLVHRYSMGSGLYEAYKGGRMRFGVQFESYVSDETWTMIDRINSGTKERYRFTMTTPNAADTFQVDAYELDFEEPLVGHDGREYVTFKAAGAAHVSSAGNFLTVSLT